MKTESTQEAWVMLPPNESIPNSNILAEEYILGSAMYDFNLEILVCLDKDDFSLKANRILFSAIIEFIHTTNGETMQAAFWNFLKRKNVTDDIGGFSYYCSIVRKHFSDKRYLLSAIADVRTKAQTRKLLQEYKGGKL